MQNLPESRQIVYWFTMNLTEDMASKFMCTLSLKEPVNDENVQRRSSLTYKFLAHSLFTPFDIIHSSANCAPFMYSTLIPFSKRQATCHTGETYEYNWKMFMKVESSTD